MSSKRNNENFLQGGGDEETRCLLHTFTDVKKESVSSEETKNHYDKGKLGSRGQQDEETFEREKYLEAADVVIVVDETTDSNKIVVVTGKHQDKETQEFKKQDVTGFIREEFKVEDEDTTERFPSLAEPEDSESEDDSEPNDIKNERLLLYENFENEACEKCFKILEENAEQLTKLSCAEKTCTLEDSSLKKTDTFDETTALKENEKACKLVHDVDLDSSGSFRASIHSLSTCHDSLPSSRGCPTKRDLYLDLECRICHDTEGQDLISPCHCAGTSKWVHESCIIKWIRHTKTKQCEICTCPITVKRKKKPIEQLVLKTGHDYLYSICNARKATVLHQCEEKFLQSVNQHLLQQVLRESDHEERQIFDLIFIHTVFVREKHEATCTEAAEAKWTSPSATCGPCNKLDIWYCFVLALCVLIIIGFVVLQSHYNVTDQIETTIIFASIYVLCGMIIMIKARYFWTWFVQRSSFWGNWKNLNEEWRIIEANEANVQSPVSPV